MSVEALALALHHSNAKGATKIVLLGIANHAGDGGSWPSVPTLAAYANVSDRQVQTSIDQLIKTGELRRDVQAGGLRNMADFDRPNLYHLTLSCPVNCDGTTAHRVSCVSCGKALRPRERRLRTLYCHRPECHPDPVKSSSPGEVQFTGGDEAHFTQTVPEPSTHLSHYPKQPQTARGATCTTRNGLHNFHPTTGWCLNACGARDEERP